MAVMMVTSRCTDRENKHEIWNECAQGGIATHITDHTRETGESGKGKVIVSPVQPFNGQGV